MNTFISHKFGEALEVLIMNDGSSDKTERIAKQFQVKYPNIFRVITKENGGHGSTINLGIKEAKGKYFKVVDGDDWVETENLIKLVNDLRRIDCDIIINPYYTVSFRTKIKTLIEIDSQEYGVVLPFESVAKEYQKFALHAITFRTLLLRDNNIQVREKCCYEDNEYALFPIKYAGSICFLKYPIYNYLIDQKEQTINDAKVLENACMFYRIVRDCIDYYEKLDKDITLEKRDYIKRTLFEIIRSQYNIFLRSPIEIDTYKKLCRFDDNFKNKYLRLYQETSQRYKYLKVLQAHSFFGYAFLSAAMKLYKKINKGKI